MKLYFNSKGGAYYCWDAVPVFLFANHQFWNGITTNSKYGALMYKESENFKLAGHWRKQQDDSIFIQSALDEWAGWILIPSMFIHERSRLPDSYEVYWATGSNALENLVIRDNPT